MGREHLARLTPVLQSLFKVGKGSPNQELGPAIRPGDTVGFRPTDVLHQIPLYAIPIDGIPIIEKHPVVYCSNLTIIRHCVQTVQTVKHPTERKALIPNPMPSHWPDGELVKSTLDEFPTSLVPDTLAAGISTKKEVLEGLSDAVVFHYHGHIAFKKQSAMESFIKLKGTEQVSANNLFEVRRAKPTLATVIGCRSGGSVVSRVDDLLGIPLALH